MVKRGKEGDLGLNDPLLERDIKVLCISYMKREFIFDCAANVPILFYELLRGWPTDAETMGRLQSYRFYRIFMGLKLLRFTHIGEV